MRPSSRTAVLLAVAVLLTFVVTKTIFQRYTTREVVALMAAEDQKMEAFNDVGRLEVFDSLKDFLGRGCIREAQEFIELQQSLLLSGIAHRMKEDTTIATEVTNRSAAVAERARAGTANLNPSRTIPRCP